MHKKSCVLLCRWLIIFFVLFSRHTFPYLFCTLSSLFPRLWPKKMYIYLRLLDIKHFSSFSLRFIIFLLLLLLLLLVLLLSLSIIGCVIFLQHFGLCFFLHFQLAAVGEYFIFRGQCDLFQRFKLIVYEDVVI